MVDSSFSAHAFRQSAELYQRMPIRWWSFLLVTRLQKRQTFSLRTKMHFDLRTSTAEVMSCTLSKERGSHIGFFLPQKLGGNAPIAVNIFWLLVFLSAPKKPYVYLRSISNFNSQILLPWTLEKSKIRVQSDQCRNCRNARSAKSAKSWKYMSMRGSSHPGEGCR